LVFFLTVTRSSLSNIKPWRHISQESEGRDRSILNLDPRRRWVVSFTPRSLYPPV
jgi:hypothetical protein